MALTARHSSTVPSLLRRFSTSPLVHSSRPPAPLSPMLKKILLLAFAAVTSVRSAPATPRGLIGVKGEQATSSYAG